MNMNFTRNEWLIILSALEFKIKKAKEMNLELYTKPDEDLLIQIKQHLKTVQEQGI